MDDKLKALAFVQTHQVSEISKDMLNTLVQHRPENPIAFLVHYLEAATSSSNIEKIIAFESLASNGSPTITVEVWCSVIGRSQLVASVCCPLASYVVGEVAGEWKSIAQGQDPLFKVDAANPSWYQRKGVAAVTAELNEKISPVLANANPHDIAQNDQILWQLDQSANQHQLGGNSITAVSLALLVASAKLKAISLYKLVQEVLPKYNSTHQTLSVLPAPLVTIFSPRTSGGKLRVRGIHLCPPPHLSNKQGLHNIALLTTALKEILLKKSPLAANPALDGSYPVLIDKIEQAFELLNEAATLAGLRFGQHVCIGIDYGANGLWDAAKSKYEVIQGNFKSLEDLIIEIVDLISAHPEIIAIQDPLRKEDQPSTQALLTRLPAHCYLSSSQTDDASQPSVVTFNQFGTFSRFAEALSHLKEPSLELSSLGDAGSTYLADIAVGINARFLKAGGLSRERVVIYNRLLQIEEELTEAGLAQSRPDLNIRTMTPPPPAQPPTQKKKKGAD